MLRWCFPAQHENDMADYRSTGKELRKSPKGLFAALLGLAVLAGCGWGVMRIIKGMNKIEPMQAEESSEQEVSVPELSTTDEPESKVIYQYEAVFASDVHSGPLMIVNRDHATEDITDGLVTIYSLKNSFYGLRDVSLQLREEPIKALNEMAEAIRNDLGYAPFLINTAYRTKADQRKIYSSSISAQGENAAAMAGFSDFETGYSVGITLTRNGGYYELSGEKGAAEREWMETNAAKYGFILRYPQGKESVTQFAYDASHYRYVGAPHALYMQEHGLCLEEYIELLRSGYSYPDEHLTIPDGQGRSCEVFFAPLGSSADTGTFELPVPIDYPYTYSGNNIDGFVVTVTVEAETADTPDSVADETTDSVTE